MNNENTANRTNASLADSSKNRHQAFINDLQKTYSHMALGYGMVIEEAEKDNLRGSSLVTLQNYCEVLAEFCQKQRAQLRAEAVQPAQNKSATIYLVPSAGGVENRPKTMTFGGYMKRQAEELGLQPMPLEADLLINRVRQRGESGQFLADAYLSAYRKGVPFKHALFELINLDAEGFRLFHQILHIRHVPGWDDSALYELEQQIISILEG